MSLPNINNINAAIEIYDELEGWKQANRIITSYIENHPNNTNEQEVTIKVSLINDLYYARLMQPLAVANYILQLKNIDQNLKSGDIQVVDTIANYNQRTNISFPSKYAHFHNKSIYAFYDQYVCDSLGLFMGEFFKVKQKTYRADSYQGFYEVIDTFRKVSKLNNVPWEDIDKYLWLYGIKKAIEKGKKEVSQEVFEFYNSSLGQQMFKTLEP